MTDPGFTYSTLLAILAPIPAIPLVVVYLDLAIIALRVLGSNTITILKWNILGATKLVPDTEVLFRLKLVEQMWIRTLHRNERAQNDVAD